MGLTLALFNELELGEESSGGGLERGEPDVERLLHTSRVELDFCS